METVLSIRLDASLVRQLDERAAQAKVSRSELIRSALRNALSERRGSAYDALARYAGVMEGPADLSTNKKYLATLGRTRRSRAK
jgi:metal-responsive CopG/Arc/MetJ family transcriptional regulator